MINLKFSSTFPGNAGSSQLVWYKIQLVNELKTKQEQYERDIATTAKFNEEELGLPCVGSGAMEVVVAVVVAGSFVVDAASFWEVDV